jgi:RNA polymerase sigma factor (sigma-70 family)
MNSPLSEYVRTGSADAFRQIVEAHIDSVYSQCLRRLHNVAQAEDATQVVFATLAQKAARLPAGVVLEGWLFTTTRFCCAHAQRSAVRRAAAEKKAATMKNEATESSASNHAASAEIEELLDDAIAHLGDRDRNAVLLRFFGGKSVREVGDVLGVSEDAAKQRILRAVEKLRAYFKSKGVTTESATLTASLGMAVKPAAAELTRATIQTAAATTMLKAGIFSRLNWTWPKLTAGIAAAIVVTGAVIVINKGGTLPQLPSKPPTAQMTSAPLMADVLPADAAQPLDQSTPVNTLRKLSTAIQANNRKAIAECLCDDGIDPDTAAAAHAYFFEQASLYRLLQAWQNKFPGADMDPGGMLLYYLHSHVTFEMIFNRALDFPGGLKATIEGNIAQVQIPLPRADFLESGPHQMNAAVAYWSGAMLVFNLADGNWKLDTDRTFNFVIHVGRYANNESSDMAMMAKVCAGVADGLDAVAADIESGKLTTSKSAISAVEAAADRAYKDADAKTVWWMPLPLVGGS